MINQGLNVGRSYSGFRSYDYQKTLYDNYVSRDGQAAADRYSARPGYSEHQTGLVFDLTDKSGNLLEDSRASQWLKAMHITMALSCVSKQVRKLQLATCQKHGTSAMWVKKLKTSTIQV